MRKILSLLMIVLLGVTASAVYAVGDVNIVDPTIEEIVPEVQQTFEEDFPIDIDESGFNIIEYAEIPQTGPTEVPEASVVWSEPESPEGDSGVINPMTGLPVRNASLLSYPPVFIPISRYPSVNRPSYGTNSAAWVFEMYVSDEESRPVLMFYGDFPREINDKIARLSSAIFGLEALRLQYGGVIIAGGTSKSVLDSDIKNLELWYGTDGNQKYPILPLENLKRIVDRWAQKTTPADPNNLVYPFSDEAPSGGTAAESLMVRYAADNIVLWKYDAYSRKYFRSQNSPELPGEPVEDKDMNDGAQVNADNIIILIADHSAVPGFAESYNYFDINLNYVGDAPALILRDGKIYPVRWTTKSEDFEVQSNRMRPIRFYQEDGTQFNFKPGRTWVHIVTMNDPLYEVDTELGSTLTDGSGHWKLPYISFKTNARERVEAEVPELKFVK